MFNFKNQRKMKKVVRMLGLCALVALAFTSCKKNDDTNKVTFKATAIQSSDQNRTYMDDSRYWVLWDDNDEITVFNNAGENPIVCPVISDYDKLTATFEGDGAYLANLATESYTAFYPASIDGGNVTMNIPATQQYVKNGFQDELFPMYAVNGGANGDDFQFATDAGLLGIVLKTAGNATKDYTISQIVVEAEDTNDELVGTMVYPYDAPVTGANYTVTSPSYQVTLQDCASEGALSRTDFRYYYFVLLDGALAGNFTVTITTTDNEVITLNSSAADHNPIVKGKKLMMDSYSLGAN